MTDATTLVGCVRVIYRASGAINSNRAVDALPTFSRVLAIHASPFQPKV